MPISLFIRRVPWHTVQDHGEGYNIQVEICAVLGYYAASCGNSLPTFRGNVSVPSSKAKSPNLRMIGGMKVTVWTTSIRQQPDMVTFV
jgi:hypothetical protein